MENEYATWKLFVINECIYVQQTIRKKGKMREFKTTK